MSARFFAVALLYALSGSASARDAGASRGLAEDAFFDGLPVVLSASRLAQSLADTPSSVTVIDAAMIRRSGARGLADLLRQVPGFLVAQSINGAPHAAYHGMTDQNPRGLQILVDGRSQFSPLYFGGVNWNLIDISLDEIARIEVIRGSNSAAYGSNAFLGVVNVVTLNPAETQGVRVRVAGGDEEVEDRYARMGMHVGDAFVRLSAETKQDGGVAHANDGLRNQRFNMRADIPFGLLDELQVLAGVTDMNLQVEGTVPGLIPSREQRATKDFISLQWLRHLRGDGELALRYVRSNERFSDIFDSDSAFLRSRIATLSLPFMAPIRIRQRIQTTRDDFELQHTLMPSSHTRLVWGAGARYDAVRGPLFYNTHSALRQDVHRVFGNLEWRPSEAWTTNLGMTWERDSLSDMSLAPRLAVNYHVSPRQTVRAGISRAHRLPSLTEERARTYYGAFDGSAFSPAYAALFITRHARGGLEKEVIDSKEIAYLGDFGERGVFLDVRFFHEQIRGRIVPAELPLQSPNCEVLVTSGCGTAIDFLNAQDVLIRGLEYQLRWRPRAGSELTLNQSFVRIKSKASAELFGLSAATANSVEQHMDHSAPRVSSMLRWTQSLPWGLEASLSHFRYSGFQWSADSSVDAFGRTDVRLGYPFVSGRTKGELALTLEGVSGKRAEYRRRDIDPARAAVPQFVDPRGWVTLVLEF